MATSTAEVYQFKISLKAPNGWRYKTRDPKIWRRILVPSNYNFWDLHVAIQDAMGWRDCHLHQFEITNPTSLETDTIGIPDEDAFEKIIPEKSVPITKYFVKAPTTATYLYDFGDEWFHEIVFENIIPAAPGVKYPKCVEGERACPPEDCGGVPGYKELLKILAKPNHKEYEERLEWMNTCFYENYDPTVFDSDAIVFHDPQERWKLAFK